MFRSFSGYRARKRTANSAIKEYAMGDDPIFIRFASTKDDLAILHQHTY
ncbi:MAG: hypothetical protein IPF75_14660 [Bacteroidetes bacterium]|nr:hypothetical protein [Bacteroidota bacterium]